jgi:hypothetical protein
MMSQFMRTGFLNIVLVTVCVALLTACGGGGGSSSKAPGTVVSGSVGDGPVTGATVAIFNAKGALITTETSDDTATYTSSLNVPQRDYPLLLKVSDGIDLVTGDAPDFELVSVMMRPSHSTANINPFSTLIVKMAQSMAGGVNAENIRYSNAVVMEKFSFGLDPSAIDNAVTKKIANNNIAQIVKSSEALGEMVRRTRDEISATGHSLTGDDVVNAIAADMADGFLDGIGATGSNSTIAAVANVVSGQVLVETMTNTLKVKGVIATVVIDQSISSTHSTAKSSQMTDSVGITSGLIDQAKRSVAAAQVVDSSARLTDLAATIDTISVGALSAEASKLQSAEASRWLDHAVTTAAGAHTEDVISINLAANNSPVTGGGAVEPVTSWEPDAASHGAVVEKSLPPVVENTPPKVAGSPATSVIARNSYSFEPGARDTEGDVLIFGIVNKPAWASFDASTGRLKGVPAKGDVGDYENIVISVSDGAETVSLAAFNIQVQPGFEATGRLELSWLAPSTRTDGAPLSLSDIDGYRLYYGKKKGDYILGADIKDGTAQTATVTGVPVGKYYVVMTTYDTNGVESGYSQSVIKNVM